MTLEMNSRSVGIGTSFRYSSYSSSSKGNPTKAKINKSNCSFLNPDLRIRPRLSRSNLVLNGERVEWAAAFPDGVALNV